MVHEMPLKVRTFVWLITKDSTLTQNNLQKRKWIGLSMCVLYKVFEETIQHLMIHYGYFWTVVGNYTQLVNLLVNLSTRDCIWNSIRSVKGKSKLHAIVVAAVCWNILKKKKQKNFFFFKRQLSHMMLAHCILTLIHYCGHNFIQTKDGCTSKDNSFGDLQTP